MIDMSLVTLAGIPRSGAGGQDAGKEVNRHRELTREEHEVLREAVKDSAEVVALGKPLDSLTEGYKLLETWEGRKLARILPHDGSFHYFQVGMRVLVSVKRGFPKTYEGVPEKKREFGVSWQNLHREHFELIEEIVEAVVRPLKVGDFVTIKGASYHAFADGRVGLVVEVLPSTREGRAQYDVKLHEGELRQVIYGDDLTRS